MNAAQSIEQNNDTFRTIQLLFHTEMLQKVLLQSVNFSNLATRFSPKNT